MDMTDPKRIVFLYSRRSVPQEIIDIAYKKVPEEFDLTLLEQATDASEKIKHFAEADFILGYPGDMTEQEIRSAKKCRLLQLMSAGYDRILLPVWREMQVPVANNGGANALPPKSNRSSRPARCHWRSYYANPTSSPCTPRSCRRRGRSSGRRSWH